MIRKYDRDRQRNDNGVGTNSSSFFQIVQFLLGLSRPKKLSSNFDHIKAKQIIMTWKPCIKGLLNF